MSDFRFRRLERHKVGGTTQDMQLSIPIPKSPSGKIHRFCPLPDCEPNLFQLGEAPANETALFEVWGVTELDLSIGEAPPPSLTAEAGGPYSGVVGASIALSGSASGGTAPYTYAWDLDNDGAYDDATGASPSHSWDAVGIYTIGLQVTDNVSATATDTSTVTVTVTAFDPYIYDTNGDGEFSKAETLAAVNAYLAGTITKNSVLEVIKLYFA